MKYFIKGYCVKSCKRAHRLFKDEEKSFDDFILKCRSSDFSQGAEETEKT
jgi:hypothetical protein